MPTKTSPKKRGKRREFEFEDITTSLQQNYEKLNFKFKKRDFKFTEKQKELISILRDPSVKLIIIEGPAGTSKTLISVYVGLMLLQEHLIDKLLYIRSVIESAHKSLGFLPGDLSEKLLVWRAPLDDKISELVEIKDIHKLSNTDKIEVMPINYVRGSSWRNSFVIFDEFQNTLLSEAKTLLTRIGEGSKLILCGDSGQSDIKDSGFPKILEMFDDEESEKHGIVTFRFDERDIVRSEIVKYIVNKFES